MNADKFFLFVGIASILMYILCLCFLFGITLEVAVTLLLAVFFALVGVVCLSCIGETDEEKYNNPRSKAKKSMKTTSKKL